MGFPLWTLFGMALTAAGAVIVLTIAYIAQSPKLINRLGLSGSRIDMRARAFTGYALALLLLAVGFFVAGVPLGSRSPEPEMEIATPMLDMNESGAMAIIATTSPEAFAEDNGPEEQESNEGQPVTGAFAGPPPSARTATAEALTLPEEGAPTGTATPPPTATFTPTPTPSATPTHTPTPTVTPTPTLTPTPIFEETALINTGTSTLWVKRTPGGQDITLLKGGDIVVLQPGHANIGGVLWREVSTVNGTIGWVQESYIDLQQEDEGEIN